MGDLTKECVLRVYGSWMNNTSYFEEANGGGSIDETYTLKEGMAITPFGHEIKVVGFSEDSVTLWIKGEEVSLREGDTICVVSKDNSRGKNDDFMVDRESLFVSLVNYKAHLFHHLLTFVDKREEIDEKIKKISHLLAGKRTYYQIAYSLRSLLYRIENEEAFGHLEAVEKGLPYQSIIVELLSDIEVYFSENNALLKLCSDKKQIRSEEYAYLSHYLFQLAMEDSSHEHIPFDPIHRFICFIDYHRRPPFYANYDLTEREMTEFLYLLMKIHAKSNTYFENSNIAWSLVKKLANAEEETYDFEELMLYHEGLAEYFLQIRNRPEAREHYLRMAEIAKRNGNLKESAYALSSYYRLNNSFPESMKTAWSREQIEKEYGEYASIVLRGIESRPLKVCESEFDPVFIENYFLVMRAVEDEITRVGDLHIPYQRWELIQKIYFEKYNISWKTPKQMNPRVMFD